MQSVNEGRRRDNEWFPFKTFEPWGEAVALFAQEHPNKVMAWVEAGASLESQRWWQHIYPQLVWETEGPLAPR